MNVATTVIKCRRSIRKYKSESIPEEVIRDALECAFQAPTARNEQPWLFGVVKDPQTLSRIAGLVDTGKFIADAPICFAVFGKREARYYLEDCCAATTQLILGLWAYGIGSCWVAGEKKPYVEAVRTLLNVPGDYTLVSLVAAGYPADIPVVKKKDRTGMQFAEKFGEH